ncbi:hypothetical protein JB92DRAFT_2856481 [Gautieria morchelliformis]|nr:hypothetical protein JB92DRAFT_2856481 [Gautieria morchelliformis]
MTRFVMSELPSAQQLAEAKETLASSQQALQNISRKIDDAEQTLAEIVASTRCRIDTLTAERATLQREVTLALAYISPIRRLPQELLREVFLISFEHNPKCAWGHASVCALWRRIALSMPKLWSKIRLETTQNDSADTIRLWLERSGMVCPLDIEITLQVSPPASAPSIIKPRTRGRSHSYSYPPPLPSPPLSWSAVPVGQHGPVNITTAGGGLVHYLPPGIFPSTPVVVSPPPHSHSNHSSPQSNAGTSQSVKAIAHWGHIAMYYLTQQMERWERFVFRFDKSFPSISALKSISGSAPLMKHFEVSCSEAGGCFFDNTWSWLPTQQTRLPSLRSFTLSNMPFKWSCPMLSGSGLTSISIRALPISTLSLDRLQHILTSNSETLGSVSLSFPTAQPAILPLTPLTLAALNTLSLSGHHLLAALLDTLILPSLESLSLTLELSRNPEPLEETITSLLLRSHAPPLTSLTLAHGANNFFYATPGPGNGALAPWSFLNQLPMLTHLIVTHSVVEPLLALLAGPEEENNNQWLCPELTVLALRLCHPQSDGVAKLVSLVEARNPDLADAQPPLVAVGVVPTRLKSLELNDCLTVGVDVLGWLKSRVEEVIVIEPAYERRMMSRSPSYGW